MSEPTSWDVIVIGAGTAGIPAAVCAAERGARVLLLDHASQIGGALHMSGGQLSAAGTRLQAARGISDSPDAHFDDVMRISDGKADPAMVRRAVTLAPDTLHWLLDSGFEVDPATPAIFHGHEAYRVARTYWGTDRGFSVMRTLARLLDDARARGVVTLRLDTAVEKLLQGPDGTILGVRARRKEGQDADIHAANVVLATGGYAASAEFFARVTPGVAHFPWAYAYNQGIGHRMALDAGAVIRNADKFLPQFGGVQDPRGGRDVTFLTETTPQHRLPWEIYVNTDGDRFVAEDEPSMDLRERALLAQPAMTFWTIYDQRTVQEAPPLFARLTPAEVEQAFRDRHPSFVRADSLTALAMAAGISADRLVATVRAYNDGVATGKDPLGRRHLPLPIDRAPFYAVRHHGVTIVSFAGLAVDDDLRVLDRTGKPIPHLYAAGEILGFAAFSGSAFAGGMSVTPALSFGRLLGQRILHW